MVKIWEDSEIYCYKPGDNESRILDEVILLRHHLVINHPNMIKLYGFCYEVGRHLGVVYDFNPFDSVYNLVLKDDFTWLQRINVLVQFASLLGFLHTIKSPYKPLTLRNLDCAHIVLDKDYNPKLCDFGLVTGGIFPDRAKYKCRRVIGSYGYMDVGAWLEDHAPDKPDVFAFGNILLSLISKRVFTEQDRQNLSPYVFKWAYTKFLEYKYGPDSDSEKDDSDRDSSKKHDSNRDLKNDDSDRDSKKPKFSLFHQSLAEEPDFDPSDGPKITALGMDCTHDDFGKRPTMKQVLSFLLNLEVVKKNIPRFR
ncbi:PREDICTED: probable receptor-like protein kinase At5g15080 [Erythranthe guttata]|uniref:probable receptor-like protein kinase At5g15080 n=1 Tax=Erythranthe guttata TaxID=4155 RepID=UPI00064DC6E7|nr:PREDICTED: probable receptor-like protein kinase At5g15080 [Erythranthe guttata]|eukprot:XP_012830657.1 PREDICTED: probable receptor-like protein kinase At5g15080 [Erythranthe guttata]